MTGRTKDSAAADDDLIRQEADLIKAGVALQTEGLKMLLAEMQALAILLPHGPSSPATKEQTSSEIEDGFDNMPV